MTGTTQTQAPATGFRVSFKPLIGAALGTLLLCPATAQAGGTRAGTEISAQPTLSYSLQGQSSSVTVDDVAPVVFDVRRVVDMVVTSQGDVQLSPGQRVVELDYRLLNTGNGSDRFGLSAEFTLDRQYIESWEFLRRGESNSLIPLEEDHLTLDMDHAVDLVLRVRLSEDYAADQGETFGATVKADSRFADRTDKSIAGQTTRNEDDPPVFRDGTGSSSDSDGDGAHSAQSQVTHVGHPITLDSLVFTHSEDGAACGDFTTRPDRGHAIPEACIEYSYTLTHDGSQADAEDIAFEVALDRNLVFRDWVVTGLSGAQLSAPAQGTDCGTEGCTPSLSGATLAQNTRATIRIHAFIK